MAEARENRWGWLRKLLLSLLVAALLLGGLELAARVALGGEFHAGERSSSSWKVLGRFDPELGWANDAGASARIANRSYRYRASIDALGMRDPPRSERKAPGVQRVLVLGDSVAWGWGVDDGARFCDLAGAALGPKIELVDAAVPGYGTDQELWTLAARGDALAPDLVLLVFVLNDVLEAERAETYDMRKPRFVLDEGAWRVEGLPVPDPRSPWQRRCGQRWAQLCASSALHTGLVRWRGRRTTPAELEPRGRPFNAERAARVREVAGRMLDPHSPARHALELIRAWCRERSVPFAMLVLPHKHDQYLYEPLDGRPEFDGATELTKVMRRVASELAFPLLDVDAKLFEASGRGERLHCGDGHLNAEGNRIVAAALAPKLAEWLAKR